MEVAPKDNINEFIENNKNSFSQLKFSFQAKNEISSYMPGQFYDPSFLQQKIQNNIIENKNQNPDKTTTINKNENNETKDISMNEINNTEKEKEIVDPDNDIFKENKKNIDNVKEGELSDSNSIKEYLNLQTDDFKDQMLVQLSEFKKGKNRKENKTKFRWKIIFKGCILIREIYDDQNKNKFKKDIYLGQLKANLETDW
jgi:hypothetical protein